MSDDDARETVFLVEDNPTNLELASDLLEVAGYRVVHAATGEKALASIPKERPALILMDIHLPGMDGLEVTRRLKHNPETAHIPVVALTASVMKGQEWLAIEAGCVGYIAKPIDTRQFAATVASYMNGATP